MGSGFKNSGHYWHTLIMQKVLFLLGVLFVPLGVAGIVLPFLPGTPLLVLAAVCFARSSPKFESYLVNHPLVGAPIRSWRATGAIPLRAKFIALLAVATSIGIIFAGEAPKLPKAIAVSTIALAAAYVISRPNSYVRMKPGYLKRQSHLIRP